MPPGFLGQRQDSFRRVAYSVPSSCCLAPWFPRDIPKSLPAPGDEVGDVVPGEKGATLGRGQKVHVAHAQDWSGQPGCDRFRHGFVPCHAPGDVLFGGHSHVVGMLLCGRIAREEWERILITCGHIGVLWDGG